mmetsp:Transcript_19272/g.48549  ORF Transcript_19272/g.48549 Transcript_19272/m.48549 type:complete len:356 (-) Transcript_19272:1072-2139(-)
MADAMLLQEGRHLPPGNGLASLHRLHQLLQRLVIANQRIVCLRLGPVQQVLDLLLRDGPHLHADVGHRARLVAVQVHLLIVHQGHRSQAAGKAAPENHLARNVIRDLKVICSGCANVVLAQESPLRNAARHQDGQLALHVGTSHHPGLEVGFLRDEVGVAGRHPTWADAHLGQLLVVGRDVSKQCLGALVDSDVPAHQRRDDVVLIHDGLPAAAHLLHVNLLQRLKHVVLAHSTAALSDSHDGGLVHEVHQLRPCEAGGGAGHPGQVHIRVQFLVSGVHPHDLHAALLVGQGQVDDAVEAARPRERIVQGRRAVGRRHDNHSSVVLKAVHLREKLVDGVHALVVAGSSAVAALLA